jgi:WD40 repeat protein
VPEAALLTLWSEIYDDEEDARDAAQLFVERSLMSRDDQRRYRLHDLYHDYLHAECADLPAAHGRFVEAYRKLCPNGWASGPNDGYFFQHLPWHLEQAGRRDQLRGLLLDYAWIKAKLAATDVPALLGDYAQTTDPDVTLVDRALMLSANVISGDPRQLPTQVAGRLRNLRTAPIDALVKASEVQKECFWLCPRTRSLTPPGPLLRRFVGHGRTVTSVALLTDGLRGLSGSEDRTLRLWNLETQAELRRFEGHEGAVNSVALLADGLRALSGSEDLTLRLWDLEKGAELRRFEGHEGGVTSVAVLSDGRHVLSGSTDRTLRLWNLETAAELRRFAGHKASVNSVALLSDGRRALSGSDDLTLRLWDLETGAELRHFESKLPAISVAMLVDGRRAVAACSPLIMLRLWDLETGVELNRFDGFRIPVTSVAVSADGRRALSGS